MNMPLKSGKNQEQGFASMTIALVLVLVLALLTVGFAQLARREQKNTLDKQLATQAYYAAESGINEVIHQIKINTASYYDTTSASTTNSCRPIGSGSGQVPAGNFGNGVSYSCVIINTRPTEIEYGGVEANQGRSITFDTSGNAGNGAGSLTVEWTSTTSTHTNYSHTPPYKFLPATQWATSNTPAVIQLSLTPLADLSQAGLLANTFNVYLYPSSDAPSSPIFYNNSDPSKQARIIPGNCGHGSGTYACSVTISGLNGLSSKYLLHLVNYYDTSNILINGKTQVGDPVQFINGQAVVDVTGKAKDVLKRLQVRIPIDKTAGDENIPPDFVIQSGDTCKRQQTEPNQTDYLDLNGANVDGDANNPCNLAN